MIRWPSLQILGQKLILNACLVSYQNIPTTRHLLKFERSMIALFEHALEGFGMRK